MPTSRKVSTEKADESSRRSSSRKGSGSQPPATGANKGSPAASVMKQFQKTKTESGGRS